AREALDLPLRAFPSWFLRIECDRRGKATMLNEASAAAPCRSGSSAPACVLDKQSLLREAGGIWEPVTLRPCAAARDLDRTTRHLAQLSTLVQRYWQGGR